MKVFISWSGPLSKQIAVILHEWIQDVIQAIKPWMSGVDIDKGARWSSEIAIQLQDTKAGIICVTPDNQDAPWLNFEAGALSKAVETSRVCTYVFQMKPSDLKGPLTQFQATETSEEDTWKLVTTLNKALGEQSLPDNKLRISFDRCWGELRSKLAQVSTDLSTNEAKRSPEDLLDEVLSLARDQARSIEEIKVRQHFAEVRQIEREKEASNWSPLTALYGNQVYGGLSGTINSDSSSGPYGSFRTIESLPANQYSRLQAFADLLVNPPASENTEPEIDPAGEGPLTAPPTDPKDKL